MQLDKLITNALASERHNSNTPFASDTAGEGLIGIVTNSFESPYYGRIVEGASSYLHKKGYKTIVQSTAKSRAGELECWSSLSGRVCDGLIFHSSSLNDEELIKLLEANPGSVLMNRHIAPFSRRCVYPDNVRGGFLAGAHLADRGHEKIAMVTGPTAYYEVHERTRGFHYALSNHINPLTAEITIVGDFMIDSGAKAIQSIVENHNEVTAIFFHNDNMALGALEQCAKLGINVPNDISIIGYDDLSECRFTSPNLTSIRQPLTSIGEAAASLILEVIGRSRPVENSNPSTSFFAPELVIRDSVRDLTSCTSEPLLSQRELDCLEWTAIGKTSWEISVIMGIAESTVNFHITNTTNKLNANNRTHATILALKNRLIRGDFGIQPG